ncbi:2,3-diketo-5-methylthiopentyl-1-phosphate enolase-phosphatase [Alloactinosynnema sp. L-07]|nr:2,3-diketo-5-methylthiopentyl-1-phosphate enolase-phosphatase [Alloactinosynnema sp. L-07]
MLDIEGTTSPLSAVHDVLFPYARDRITPWITGGREGTAEVSSGVREFVGRRLDAAEVAAVLVDWHDRNLKHSPLKTLHGLIWAEGFAAGDLTGVIYPDVPPALAAWQAAGVGRWIYSSGSVLAQRLWFSRTDHGDLLGLLDGHFDTVTGGPKKETASYQRIAAAIGAAGPEILFLSDAVAELDAAQAAGWQTIGVSRPQDDNPDVGTHRAVKDFGDI